MRRLLLIGVLAVLPCLARADLQAGGVLLYDADLPPVGEAGLVRGDLRPGAEARLKLWFLQLGLVAVPFPERELLLLSDLGVAFDASFLRVGVAWGLCQWISLDQRYPTDIGMHNIKLAAEARLGPFSLGLSAWWFIPAVPTGLTLVDVVSRPPVLGLTALVGTPR